MAKVLSLGVQDSELGFSLQFT